MSSPNISPSSSKSDVPSTSQGTNVKTTAQIDPTFVTSKGKPLKQSAKKSIQITVTSKAYNENKITIYHQKKLFTQASKAYPKCNAIKSALIFNPNMINQPKTHPTPTNPTEKKCVTKQQNLLKQI